MTSTSPQTPGPAPSPRTLARQKLQTNPVVQANTTGLPAIHGFCNATAKPTHSEGGTVPRQPRPKPKRKGEPKEPTLGEKLTLIRAITDIKARNKALSNFVLIAQGFTLSCARWYFGDDLDREDVIITAQGALWEAICDWDATPRADGWAPFDTHARWKIRGALSKMLRGSKLIRGRKADRFEDIDSNDTYEDTPTEGNPEDDLAHSEHVNNMASELPFTPMAVITRAARLGYTVEQVQAGLSRLTDKQLEVLRDME